MAMPNDNEMMDMNESCGGGQRIKDVHDKMRSQNVDIGGQETTTEKLMRPQTEQDMED